MYAECNQKAEAVKRQWKEVREATQKIIGGLEAVQRDASQAEFQEQVGRLQEAHSEFHRHTREATAAIQKLASNCFE